MEGERPDGDDPRRVAGTRRGAGLADFIDEGRSRGVRTVLGFRDDLGPKEAFGENTAHEITATRAHRIFLRLGGESASRSTVEAEVVETTFAFGRGSSMGFGSPRGNSGGTTGFNFNPSSNVTCTRQIDKTDAVPASEISSLPDCEEGGGITGFACRRSDTGKPVVRQVRLPADAVRRGWMEPTGDPGFEKREESELEW